jgi:2-keto-myo-inositol isomerase
VHDTFHHHLAGETEFFPKWTGIGHLSGVTNPVLPVADMLDAHRGLVDAADRLGNIQQIKALLGAGFEGPFSFEPFASDVHDLADPRSAVAASMSYVRHSV